MTSIKQIGASARASAAASSAATGWMFAAWPFALTAKDLARWDLSILHRTLLSAVTSEGKIEQFLIAAATQNFLDRWRD